MSQAKRLHQAISLGQVLRTMSCMDDKELVQAKLDVAQTSYIDLQDRCRHKAEMLHQALSNAHLFGEDEVALMTWLSEVHDRLSKVSIQDYKPDVLEKQAAEQVVFLLLFLCFSVLFFIHLSMFWIFITFLLLAATWSKSWCDFFYSGHILGPS